MHRRRVLPCSELLVVSPGRSDHRQRPQVRTFVAAKLPDIDDYGALEPVVSGEIMPAPLKHHNTYVTNFNVAMEKYSEAR